MNQNSCQFCGRPVPPAHTACPFCINLSGVPAGPPRPRQALPEIVHVTQWSLLSVAILLALLNVLIVTLSASSAAVAPTKVPQTSTPPASVTFVDAERRIQMTATSVWQEQPAAPYGAILALHDPTRDLGMMVFAEDRRTLDSRFKDLDAYSAVLRNLLVQQLEAGTQLPPRRTKIAGYTAVQSRIMGSKGGVAITFLQTVVETPDRYFQIQGISSTESFSQYESHLLDITASSRFAPFRELSK